MAFRDELKTLYEANVPYGQITNFDYEGIFGVSKSQFQDYVSGKTKRIPHAITEAALAAWVESDEEKQRYRNMEGYPQEPILAQTLVDQHLDEKSVSFSDLLKAVMEQYTITVDQLKAKFKELGIKTYPGNIRNGSVQPEIHTAEAMCVALSQITNNPLLDTLPGFCTEAIKVHELHQRRIQEFGDALFAIRWIHGKEPGKLLEYKHVYNGAININCNAPTYFEDGRQVPSTEQVHSIIDYFLTIGPMPLVTIQDRVERENAFYDYANELREKHGIPHPDKWKPNPRDVEFGRRLKAVRLELDNGLGKDENYGSQRSIGRACGYADTGICEVEEGKQPLSITKKIKLFRHLGVRDEQEFNNMADTVIQVQQFRREHFGSSVSATVNQLKKDGELWETFASERGLVLQDLMPSRFLPDEFFGTWIARKIVTTLRGDDVTSEADIYERAGLQPPREAIERVEQFVRDFNARRSDVPGSDLIRSDTPLY